jgi:sulfonate transport system permease protein
MAAKRLSGPAILLALWWLLTETGMVSERTLPSPVAVARAGWQLTVSGELPTDMWVSLQRVIVGLTIGLAVALVIASLAGTSTRGEILLDPTMQVLKAVPNYAVVPLLILWFGIDETPKVILIALSTALPIYINTFGAIRNVDTRLVDAGRTLGLGRWGMLLNVILPGALPGFLVGLRLALTSAWLALVFAETINANSGLGSLMADAREWYRLDIMVLVLVVYATLGLLSYALVRWLERVLLAWRSTFTGDDGGR